MVPHQYGNSAAIIIVGTMHHDRKIQIGMETVSLSTTSNNDCWNYCDYHNFKRNDPDDYLSSLWGKG